MLTTSSPNYYHNLITGSPVLNGTAGSLITVLDACLVDGWGSQSATIAVLDEVATLTTPLAHNFELHQIVLIAGATPSGLNGRARVLTRTSNEITFSATGVVNGSATGTITVKLAPAGWAKEYSATNKAVYRAPVTTDGSRMYLRVDDSVGRNARVVGYESMSDVDTGIGPFPTAGQISGGGWWPKSSAADATARAWTVIADDRTAYLHANCGYVVTGPSGSVWAFGDVASYKIGDAYASAINAAMSDVSGQTSLTLLALETIGFTGGGYRSYMPKSYTETGGSIQVQRLAESYFNNNNTSTSGNGSFGNIGTFPNGPNNGLILSRIAIAEAQESTVGPLRAVMRGAYLTPQNCHASFSRLDFVDGSGDLAGRKLLAVKCGSPASIVSQGVMFFDITGPW